MFRFRTLLLLAAGMLPALGTAHAQNTWVPDIDGYISSLQNQTSFAVDGEQVERAPNAVSNCLGANVATEDHKSVLALGDHLLVSGKFERKGSSLRASRICVAGWQQEKVSGVAVLEKIDGAGRLNVDGRQLQIVPKSLVRFEAPLQSIGDARANDWVRYSATSLPNGIFAVREITIGPNLVSEEERRSGRADLLSLLRLTP